MAGPAAFAADWPTWRGDAMRGAATDEALPEDLHLQWVRELPALEPGWVDEPRMLFDAAYEPIVAGGVLFVASPRSDRVSAYDATTGEHRWDFFTNGPVRFAPTVWRDRLFFGSDDGYLYCVNAGDGSLRWKFRGGPSERLVLGNNRMISTWPVRGAAVIADDTVYFSAGIWPFMGVFIYALNADTGELIWVNDGEGAQFIAQPHGGALAFGSVAPQGYFAVSGDDLIVPNGRATPAVFNRHTGEMRFFHHQENNKVGDFAISATPEIFFNSGRVYPLETGTPSGPLGRSPVHNADSVYTVEQGTLVAYAATGAEIEEYEDSKGTTQKRFTPKTLWRSEVPVGRLHALAGDLLVCSDGATLSALKLTGDDDRAEQVWSEELPDEPAAVAVADGRLYVSTLAGRLLCFGAADAEARTWPLQAAADLPAGPAAAQAAEILERSGVRDGYALCLGIADGALLEELARQSELHLIAIDPDAAVVDRLRRRLDGLGLYGPRVTLIAGEPSELSLPPYFASLVVSEKPAMLLAADPERLFRSVRPYGGAICVALPDAGHERFAERLAGADLPGSDLQRVGDLTLLRRPDALPGAGSWTHQYGDAANTVVSPDSAVRAPLGLLWFGGSTNMDILPRHGHGPPEQVIGGRLFIEGPDSIRAQDVYTGRVLWKRDLPGFGAVYDNTSHQPGANSLGSNFSSAPDGIYAVWEGRCLRLDPATGETISEFTLPPAPGEEKPQGWGFVSVYEDLLIAGATPLIFDGELPVGVLDNWDATSSARIVALDRHSGEVLWSYDSQLAFRHNAICVADERLFCIDRLPDAIMAKMERRGEAPAVPARLVALDVRSGRELWSTSESIFGTWLSASSEHGLLLQAGRPSRDMLSGEPGDRMIVYRIADGSVVWDREHSYGGPPLLHGDTIITQERAYGLLDGEPRMRVHPLTGLPAPWKWQRTYGCNTAIASEALLTFRSGAAGFYDLLSDGGTGNLGGFKSGCTSNLVVADGVLNAPDYTRTCVCSYQNQTSLALVHDPEVELWTWADLELGEERIVRLGLNLGAPGDRMEDGTLWLEYPYEGGPSPQVEIATEPEEPHFFRRHTTSVTGELPWIGASGAEGLSRLTVRLTGEGDAPRPYTVTLHFMEPGGLAPGERVFDVTLQDVPVLRGFDIAREAGGTDRAVSRTFEGVVVGEELSIGLVAGPGSHPPVLCGVEAIAR
jgi:outer membrane protein assembly factor BamB